MSSFNKDKGIAIALTVVVHAIAVLLAFKFALVTPLPLPGEEGVEVDMGYYNQGKGDVQPVTPPAPVQAPEEQQTEEPEPEQEPEPVQEPAPEQPSEELLAENTEETPAIEEPKKEDEKTVEQPAQEEPKKPEKPKQEVNQRAMFKPSSSGQNDPSASQGNTEGVGDMGNPNGLANVNRYEGQTQHGNGYSYNLGDRGAKNIIRPDKTEFNEEGTVVVSIWVNKNGTVTKCEILPKGTTIIDERLRNMALEAARNSSFMEDANAPEVQKGTITYIFKIGE